MASWLPISEDSDFSLQNLPYGSFSTKVLSRRIGVAVGDYVLDLRTLAKDQALDPVLGRFASKTLEAETLNDYAALGRAVQRQIREWVRNLFLTDSNSAVGQKLQKEFEAGHSTALVPLSEVTMHLPFEIGDYTDFFVGTYHALNCLHFLQPGASMPPNFSSVPIAYHGRASSVVVSETPVRRPNGQYLDEKTRIATFGPSQKLDFEVEFAAFIGRGNDYGEPISIDAAEEHIFGVVMMNDWSARDIQQWESLPLGPFNGKNFSTTISPWVVTLDALEEYKTQGIGESNPLPYLKESGQPAIYDIPIQVLLKANSQAYLISGCNTKNVSFSFGQMIAHHTAGGCPLRTGDLLGTGTLSGNSEEKLGCLLEITHNGREEKRFKALTSGGGEIARTFLKDNDVIEFHARVHRAGGNVGFGLCSGQILPSLSLSGGLLRSGP